MPSADGNNRRSRRRPTVDGSPPTNLAQALLDEEEVRTRRDFIINQVANQVASTLEASNAEQEEPEPGIWFNSIWSSSATTTTGVDTGLHSIPDDLNSIPPVANTQDAFRSMLDTLGTRRGTFTIGGTAGSTRSVRREPSQGTLINRFRALGVYNDYINADANFQNEYIRLYGSSRYDYLDNQIPVVDDDVDTSTINVSLYEDGTNKPMSECVFVDHLGWFSKDDPRLVKDYCNPKASIIVDKDKMYYLEQYAEVFVDIDSSGNLVSKGDYTNRYPSTGELALPLVSIIDNSVGLGMFMTKYISLDLLNNPKFKDNYIEDIRNGRFYKTSEYKGTGKREPKVMYIKRKCPTGSFFEYIKSRNIPNTYSLTYGKRYPFGIEIETCSGVVPSYLNKELFFSAVHDGSLRESDGNVYGGEYVSDILQGDLGLKQLKKLCYQLTKRCLVDKKCGNHVHLSGINFTKENVVLMYWLYQKIQNEIFLMMPKSRRANEYCRFLDKVNISIPNILKDRKFYVENYYNAIMMVLSKMDYNSKRVNKKNDHPKGFKCGYDHSAARYCWVNFIPAVFDTRKNGVYTIEFRPMSGSTSYRKIKNWLLICFALVDVVENHKQEIYDNPNLELRDIITICYPKNHETLNKYITERKELFADGSTGKEISDYEDNEVDSNFKFNNL